MTSERFHDLVRLTEAQRQALLDRLDFSARGGGDRAENLRLERRVEYRRLSVPLQVEHPGGGVARLLVQVRNLSRGGLSFIHGGYLHVGTRCRMVLHRTDDRPVVVSGVVRTSRPLQGPLHEFGMRFDERIDLGAFMSPESQGATTMRSPGDLRGSMMTVGFGELESRLFEHVLRHSAVTLRRQPDIGAAIEYARQAYVDIALVDVGEASAGDMAPVTALRSGGFAGLVVAVGTDDAPAAAQRARAAGASEYLARPFDPETLLAAVVRWHVDAGALVPSDPVFSTLDGEAGTEALLKHFVEGVHATAQALLEGLCANTLEPVRRACISIAGSAAGYGFPSLSRTATDAADRIEQAGPPGAARAAVRRLHLQCMALSVRGECCVRPEAVSGDAPARQAG